MKLLGNFSTTEDGTWRIIDGELDLATWFPVAAGVAETLQGMTATGRVKISGEGEVRAGEAAGTIHIRADGAHLESRDGWSVG